MKAYLSSLTDEFEQHPIRGVLCALVILFALYNLFLGIRRSFSIDGDFWFQYVGGVIWNEKGNAYSEELYKQRFIELAGPDIANSRHGANRYPPQGLAFFGFFAQFPVQTAQYIMLAINLVLLAVSIWLFARLIARYRSIKLLETTFLFALAGSMYGRVNLGNSQFGIIVCTFLLASYFLARHKNKWLSAFGGVLLALTSFKPTSLPLYMLYYLWRRAYIFLAACIVAGIVLTFLPTVLNQMPLVETTQNWLTYARVQQDAGDNNPSPFDSGSAQMTHLEPLVFRILNDFSPTNRLVSNIILAIMTIYSVFLIVRTKDLASSALIDFSIVSGITLLAIYHRVHDLYLIFPALICVYLRIFDSKRKSEQVILSAILIGSLFVFTLPGDLMANLTLQNPILANSYLWRVFAPVQTWASLIIFIAIIMIKRRELGVQNSKPEPLLSTATA